MAQVINTNIGSLTAQQNLTLSQRDVTTSLERLSSGLRINGASDDAAGLAISERMASQINGLNQAARNASDAISLSQTAEGSLNQTTALLQRMRELSVQAANGTNSSTDRTALQSEITQLVAEVDRIANTTQFNGLNLLDGTFTSKAFQVGANANQTVGVSLTSAKAAALGSENTVTFGNTLGLVGTAAASPASGVAANVLTYTVAGNTSTVSVDAGDSAQTVAQKINANVPGLNATAATTVKLNAFVGANANDTLELEIDGVALGAVAAATDATTTATAVGAAIQSNSQLAHLSVVDDAGGALTISNTSGADITVKIAGGTDTGAANTLDVSVLRDDGSTYATTVEIDRANTEGVVATGALSYTTGKATGTSFGLADSGNLVGTPAGTMGTTSTTVATVDISTASGAQSAIAVLDAALATVSNSRADLGATQNRFTSIVDSLTTTSTNQSAARSRIVDADFAVETANLTRGQILQQAGIAVLAQANAAPQNVLSLLQ
jgi:flagellin